MEWLLDCCYACALAAGSPWLAYKAATTGKYRAGIGQKLGWAPLRRSRRPCLWLHGVSVGEVLAARPVLARLRDRRPDWQYVISTTTNTGLEMARKNFPNDTVFYYPLDFSWAVARSLSRVGPDMVVLMETELWPNFLAELSRRRIPTALINGRLGPGSFRGYRPLRRMLAPGLRAFHWVGVQTETYAERFHALGVPADCIEVTGSVKYDTVPTDRRDPRTRALGDLLGVQPGQTVLIAGSTQSPEEAMAMDVYHALRPKHPSLRLIVVPRHKERFDEVARLMASRGERFVKRSQVERGQPPAPDAVVLLDTLGELQHLWGLGHITFVGGSMVTRGGQNMLDPSGLGNAVLFGPHIWNFQQTVDDLLAHDAAQMVRSQSELQARVDELLSDPARASAMGQRARQYVLAQQGATAKTVCRLGQLMDAAPTRRRPCPDREGHA